MLGITSELRMTSLFTLQWITALNNVSDWTIKWVTMGLVYNTAVTKWNMYISITISDKV